MYFFTVHIVFFTFLVPFKKFCYFLYLSMFLALFTIHIYFKIFWYFWNFWYFFIFCTFWWYVYFFASKILKMTLNLATVFRNLIKFRSLCVKIIKNWTPSIVFSSFVRPFSFRSHYGVLPNCIWIFSYGYKNYLNLILVVPWLRSPSPSITLVPLKESENSPGSLKQSATVLLMLLSDYAVYLMSISVLVPY